MAKAVKSKAATSGGRRLKVYQAVVGFYDTVVAAPNQGEALKAWGVRQNLFDEGAACAIDDPEVVRAALAHPGAPLRRAVGSKDAYSLDPHPPSVPKLRGRKQAARTAPDRTALSTAEKALRTAQEAHADEAANLERRRKSLDAEELRARERWRHAETDACHALDKARRAYARAGGDPAA